MNKILFVDGYEDYHWVQALRQAVSDMNKSLVLMDYHHIGEVSYGDYELTILDASINLDLVSVIMHIHSDHPLARVVVVSSVPHWKQVRETLLAGAIDYVRKTDDKTAILDFLGDNLAKILPARKPVHGTILPLLEHRGK